MPSPAVLSSCPCEPGCRSRVASGSAPAWSQICTKTLFGKLRAPAGVPSAVLVTGNVAAAVLGTPPGGCVDPRGRCYRGVGRSAGGGPALRHSGFLASHPPAAPFPHFPGQRWPRARGAARGNDPHVQRQRGAAALAPPRALPRKEGVTQSQGPLHTPFLRQLEAAPAGPESSCKGLVGAVGTRPQPAMP